MLRPRCLLLLVALVAVLALSTSCGGGGGDKDNAQARVWEPYEITLDLPVNVDNPFDPAQANLRAVFESPSGESFEINGFATRDYTRKLAGGKEQLTPEGELPWKLRFTPTEPGDWTWQWSFTTASGTQQGGPQTLPVEEASDDRHGFLRVSPDDGRYLRFDDGTPYFAIGENLAWYGERGTYDYDAWFANLAERGVNYARLWMPSWAFGLEWTEPNTLGNYTERLDRAWQLDYVLDQAERHGIYILLSIQNHGAFSLIANSEWDRNPYNAANGGPLAQPQEVFTNDEAKQLFERRLRYIVARWGASPNVLGWELWNEVDLASTDLDDVVPWHDEMSSKLRDFDPYDHLISTSTSLPWGISAVGATDLTSFDTPLFDFWRLPNIDFSQIHLYALGGSSIDFSDVLPDMSANLRRFGKPVLVAEAGVNPLGPDETMASDPGGIGFHDMLWAGLFAQTMGTGMSWWWDNVIDPQDWYFHFGAISRMTKNIAFDREVFVAGDATVSAAGEQTLSVQSLAGSTTALVWIKNIRNQWYSPDKSEVTRATLTIQGVGSGTWQASWIDTYTNEVIEQSEVDATGSALQLNVPTFQRDIALRLDKE